MSNNLPLVTIISIQRYFRGQYQLLVNFLYFSNSFAAGFLFPTSESESSLVARPPGNRSPKGHLAQACSTLPLFEPVKMARCDQHGWREEGRTVRDSLLKALESQLSVIEALRSDTEDYEAAVCDDQQFFLGVSELEGLQ